MSIVLLAATYGFLLPAEGPSEKTAHAVFGGLLAAGLGAFCSGVVLLVVCAICLWTPAVDRVR